MSADLTPNPKPGYLAGGVWIETCSALSRECSPVGMQNVLRSKHFGAELVRLAQRRKQDCYEKSR